MDDDLRRVPRAVLVDAFRSVPPDAPTLCEGWQARHLAAHIVLRERAPQRIALESLRGRDAAIELGDAVRADEGEPGADGSEDGPDGGDRHGAAEDAARLAHYEELVREVEEGPSPLSPMAWSARMNLVEFVVHSLDVLRANPNPLIAERELDIAPIRSALWSSLQPILRIGSIRHAAREAGTGIILVVPHGPRAVVARGERSLVLTGREEELALVAMGRARHARATLTGPQDAVAAVRDALEWPEPD